MPIIGVLAGGGLAPGAPTIGTASDGGTGTSASVAFTAPSWPGKGSGTVTYTATSSPGGFTGTATSSPITVSGLTTGTAYTFTVKATTSYGVTGPSSAASNSVTPVSPSGPSYDSIATFSGNGSTGTASFTSIPSTYSHLQIRFLGYSSGIYAVSMRFNNDTSSAYTGNILYWYNSNASKAYSYNGLNDTTPSWNQAFGLDTTYGAWCDASIEDYTNTSKFKTVKTYYGKTTNAATTSENVLTVGTYQNTAAINRIDVIGFGGTFASGTSIALYGIKA